MALDCAAIITAAGASTRMGKMKALLDWKGQPLISHQIETLRDFGQTVVVTGYGAELLRPYLIGVDEAYNADYSQGRASSLRCGAQRVKPCRALLICGVDQPLRLELIEAMLSNLGEAAYIVPEFQGKSGHPIIFRGELLPLISHVSEENFGLRALVKQYAKDARRLPWEDSRIWLDLNTPEDYAEIH